MPETPTDPEHPAATPALRRIGNVANGAWDAVIRFQAVIVPVLALAVAFGVGALLIRAQGVNPGFAYRSLFDGALFTSDGLNSTLQKTTPLILTGLAVVIPLRVGLFNIGAQGQLLFGALAAAWLGVSLRTAPAPILVLVCMLAGALLGAVWAWIAGALKATRNVHEVISTIMLNSIAFGVIEYIVQNPLKEPGQDLVRTARIGEAAMLHDVGIVPVGFPIAVLLAIGVGWLLSRTTTGFSFNTVGRNAQAARYAGIRIKRVTVAAMVLAGALAGFGGAIETLGVTHRYESSFNTSLGFDGITIALLARSNPIATIPAAFLVGALRAGAANLQFQTGIKPEIVDLLMAVTLLLVSIPVLTKLLTRRRGAEIVLPATQSGGLA